MQRHRLAAALLALLAVLLAACQEVPSQIPTVEGFIAKSNLVRIACLDLNADNRINALDANSQALPDLTGDDSVDDADLEVVRRLALVLPEGRPPGCADGHPMPDWQVSPPAKVDCDAERGGLLVLGVGGGTVYLNDPAKAAGVRWMLVKIGERLEDLGVPHQLISASNGLAGTERPQGDVETLVSTYLAVQFGRQPCLRAVLLGHSHGGPVITAAVTRLEEAGLDDRILLAIPLDRFTGLYRGDSESIPQIVPLFNIYQTNDNVFRGKPIDQPNVENWDASDEKGPKDGQEGGSPKPVIHITIDNSQAVLDEIMKRIAVLSCRAGLCSDAPS